MTRWEYLELFAIHGDYGTWVEWVNDKSLDERLNIHDYLDQLGDQGWEVVAMSVNGLSRMYFLKRPKQ